jgi:hypothetical protein
MAGCALPHTRLSRVARRASKTPGSPDRDHWSLFPAVRAPWPCCDVRWATRSGVLSVHGEGVPSARPGRTRTLECVRALRRSTAYGAAGTPAPRVDRAVSATWSSGRPRVARVQHGCGTGAAWAQHGCGTGATRVQHRCNTDATQVQHRYNTGKARVQNGCNTGATRVKHGCNTVATQVRHGCITGAAWVQNGCKRAASCNASSAAQIERLSAPSVRND